MPLSFFFVSVVRVKNAQLKCINFFSFTPPSGNSPSSCANEIVNWSTTINPKWNWRKQAKKRFFESYWQEDVRLLFWLRGGKIEWRSSKKWKKNHTKITSLFVCFIHRSQHYDGEEKLRWLWWCWFTSTADKSYDRVGMMCRMGKKCFSTPKRRLFFTITLFKFASRQFASLFRILNESLESLYKCAWISHTKLSELRPSPDRTRRLTGTLLRPTKKSNRVLIDPTNEPHSIHILGVSSLSHRLRVATRSSRLRYQHPKAEHASAVGTHNSSSRISR